MSNLYGFFGDTVYRMSTKTKVEPKVIDVFESQIFMQENTANKTVTSCIKINTMDFYKEEPNEVLYTKLLDFIKKSKLTGINTLYFSLKIALDYQITDHKGGIIDAGVRYIQTDAEEVNVLLDQDPFTQALPYRKAEYLHKKFAINQINGSTYGVMDNIPKGVTFKINAITIYGNLTDMGSEYYIQNLGPSAQDTTFCHGSGTINSITAHSVVLFDTRMYGVNIPIQKFNYVPNTIYVAVEALLNQFCCVYDDTEIWQIIANNGGQVSSAPSEFDTPDGGCSPFDPVVNRKPCPGNYPFPPVHPGGHRPHPPVPPVPPIIPPIPIRPSQPSKPIIPGGCWNPEGTIVPDPDYNQDHGDVNIDEWCLAAPYDDASIKFLVVEDSIDDMVFDATTMVKYSDVLPFITDVKVGDYVKKSLVLYY